jgi:hypothetical protein
MFKWFVLYYLFCLCYVGYLLLNNKEFKVIKAIMIIFIPVLGLALSYLLFKKSNNVQPESSGESNKVFLFSSFPGSKINVEREINIIPFQEVLLSNDHHHKRSMLIDSLKDGSNTIDILFKATKSDDKETAHYAATAIMEIQKKFVTSLHSSIERMGENPTDYETMDRYAETLKEYIDSNIVDQEAKMKYRVELSELLDRLLDSPVRCKKHFVEKINCDLEIGDLEKSLNYSQMFMAEFPDDEVPYLLAMKVSYAMQNSKKLYEIMNKLKRRPIQLSPTGLKALHFWT